jgi:hypothetical protein
MQYIKNKDDIGNMDNLFSKIIKIAKVLDENGFYKESDALENHLNKVASLTTLPEGVAQLPKAAKGIWDIIKNIPKIKAPVLPKLPRNNFKPAPTSPSRPRGGTLPDVRERPSIIWDVPPSERPSIIWDTPPLEVAPPLEPETIRPLPPVLAPEFPVAIPETPTDPFAPVRPGPLDLPDTGPIIRPEPDLIPRPSDRRSPVPLPLPGNNPIPLPGGKPNPTPLPGGKPNPTPLPPGSPTPPGQKPPIPPKPPKPPKPPNFPKIPFIPPPILIPGNQLPGGELYYESGSESSRDT